MLQKSIDTRIAVIGDGGWGTTLAIHLARIGKPCLLWGAFPDYITQTEALRENRKFLPGVHIDENVIFETSIHKCLDQASDIILAVPSQYLRRVLRTLRQQPRLRQKNWIIASKGIEKRTLKLMSHVLEDEFGHVPHGVISGPTIAREVVRDMPTALVVASKNARLRTHVRHLLNAPHFTVYESDDLLGVQLGGAIKNVIAIAAGIMDGLEYGTNTKSILIARGVAEIARLGVVLGAKRTTFMGLSGLGDLATTCFSIHSRNHGCGVDLGKGLSLKRIHKKSEMVIEGIETTQSTLALARKKNIRMPITKSVYDIIFKGKNPRLTLEALMEKTLVKETD